MHKNKLEIALCIVHKYVCDPIDCHVFTLMPACTVKMGCFNNTS